MIEESLVIKFTNDTGQKASFWAVLVTSGAMWTGYGGGAAGGGRGRSGPAPRTQPRLSPGGQGGKLPRLLRDVQSAAVWRNSFGG
jgi:hypothetical protein